MRLDRKRKLGRLIAVVCSIGGIALLNVSPANALLRYCNTPTALIVTAGPNDCLTGGGCTTYERMPVGTCAVNANPCTGCSTHVVLIGTYSRPGICEDNGTCTRNPAAPATFLGGAFPYVDCATFTDC
jgi:hypothetical protein